ncbi:MAG TPA: MerR family transcriptional regulator [Thermoanaerobaculia bacterium]|nr:MerR family transcriptional regulator [Thermoanaerobaculia bacterium]
MPRKSERRRRYVMISVVAERYDIHPQTLRLYEREGLLQPARSAGNTRLYDDDALRRLELILTLTRDMGVNLAGVDVILRLREQLDRLQEDRDRLMQQLEIELRDRQAGIVRQHALVRIDRGTLVSLGTTRSSEAEGAQRARRRGSSRDRD